MAQTMECCLAMVNASSIRGRQPFWPSLARISACSMVFSISRYVRPYSFRYPFILMQRVQASS